jgi:ABC-2 type transport system ATP-binding protein
VVIARGTAEELKQRIGGERLELVLEDAADVPRAVRILEEVGTSEPVVEEPIRTVTVSVDAGAKALVQALRKLDAQHLALQDVALRRPTLDDVFLALTGRATATDVETTS